MENHLPAASLHAAASDEQFALDEAVKIMSFSEVCQRDTVCKYVLMYVFVHMFHVRAAAE